MFYMYACMPDMGVTGDIVLHLIAARLDPAGVYPLWLVKSKRDLNRAIKTANDESVGTGIARVRRSLSAEG